MAFLDFLPIVGTAVNKILGLLPDTAQRDANKHEIERILTEAVFQGVQGQLEINKTEAAHASIFVAGWRPAIGWVCALTLFYQYVVRPTWLFFHPDAPLVALDGSLWELMFGMLGIGGLRTFEKVKGVSK